MPLLVVAVAALGAVAAGDARAQEVGWAVVSTRGVAEQQPPGQAGWRALAAGQIVPGNTGVRTGAASEARFADGGDSMVVGENAELFLPSARENNLLVAVLQKLGGVAYDIERRRRPNFRVTTPVLVIGIRGTSFTVNVSPVQESVSVDEGEVTVTVTATGQTETVAAGETATISTAPGSTLSVVGPEPLAPPVDPQPAPGQGTQTPPVQTPPTQTPPTQTPPAQTPPAQPPPTQAPGGDPGQTGGSRLEKDPNADDGSQSGDGGSGGGSGGDSGGDSGGESGGESSGESGGSSGSSGGGGQGGGQGGGPGGGQGGGQSGGQGGRN